MFDCILTGGPGILLLLGSLLSAFTLGLYVGIKSERSNCERWRRQSSEENERFIQEGRG